MEINKNKKLSSLWSRNIISTFISNFHARNWLPHVSFGGRCKSKLSYMLPGGECFLVHGDSMYMYMVTQCRLVTSNDVHFHRKAFVGFQCAFWGNEIYFKYSIMPFRCKYEFKPLFLCRKDFRTVRSILDLYRIKGHLETKLTVQPLEHHSRISSNFPLWLGYRYFLEPDMYCNFFHTCSM